MNGRRRLADSRLFFGRPRLAVHLHQVHAFDRDAAGLQEHPDDLAFLAFVFAAHHADGITLGDVELLALRVQRVTRVQSRLRRLPIFQDSHLNHLWSQRYDLHVLLLAELARHGSEDTGRTRLACVVDDYHCVLVEANVGAVFTPGLLRGANHDRARHVRLLYGAVRERVLHGDDHDIAERCVPPARSAEHADHERRFRARVVRYLDHRFLLDHWSSPLTCTFDDFDHAPPLVLRQGPGLHDADGVARLGLVLLVVRFELLGAADHLAVHRMLDSAFDGDNDRLLHFVAHNSANPRLTRGALYRGVLSLRQISH